MTTATIPNASTTWKTTSSAGYCAALASAINEFTGWPIVSLTDRRNISDHFLARAPDGLLLDVRGRRTEDDVLQHWSHGHVDVYEIEYYEPQWIWNAVNSGDVENPHDVRELEQAVAAELPSE